MVVNKFKQILKEEDGQGLIEFFLFLPFILMMYSICLSLASSINASINQQKVTRGYFYYKMSNNSMDPGPRRDGQVPEAAWSDYSIAVNIWGERFMPDGRSVQATCFKFEVPLGDKEGDSCLSSYGERTTQFIRVSTAYGICGATYHSEGGVVSRYLTDSNLNLFNVIQKPGCEIR